MRPRTLFLLLLALAGCARPPVSTSVAQEPVNRALKCPGFVCLREQERARAILLEAENQRPFGVTFVLQLELENFKSSNTLPIRLALAPGKRTPVTELRRAVPERSARFESLVRVLIGTPHARHDTTARYEMPFGGSEARRVTQGVGGRETHTGQRRFAFDFAMPVGTPVLASRAGIVAEVVDIHPAGGFEPRFQDKSNRIVVAHADGSFATYGHLRRGASVRLHQSVRAGERLGHSGNSGYSMGPHLHFEVWTRDAELAMTTVPILFRSNGRDVVPVVDHAYPPSTAQR